MLAREAFIARARTGRSPRPSSVRSKREVSKLSYEPNVPFRDRAPECDRAKHLKRGWRIRATRNECERARSSVRIATTSALTLDGLSLAAYGSQGQQRTAVLALKVAEYAVLSRTRRAKRRCCCSTTCSRSWTKSARRRFLAEIGEYEQAFITATQLPQGLPAGAHLARKSPMLEFKRTRRAETLGGDRGDGSRRERLRESLIVLLEAGWTEIVGSKSRQTRIRRESPTGRSQS